MDARKIIAAIIVLAGAAASAPAAAQSDAAPMGRGLTGWTVGALAFGGGDLAAPAATTLHEKRRGGPGLALSSLGEGVALRSWAAGAEPAGGNGAAAGGLLLDVPMGGFTFTPSFGAVRGEPLSLNGGVSTALRSQLEVGYRFDNASRLSFGYSRQSVIGGDSARTDDDVLSLSYRLPFGALLDW